MVYQNSSALLAKRNTGMDTRLESEQMQATTYTTHGYLDGQKPEKKFTPWKMPEFMKEDLTELYSTNLPEDWKLFRVMVPMPYKDFNRDIYHLVEASGKCWIIYEVDEIASRMLWLEDNENFIGYRG